MRRDNVSEERENRAELFSDCLYILDCNVGILQIPDFLILPIQHGLCIADRLKIGIEERISPFHPFVNQKQREDIKIDFIIIRITEQFVLFQDKPNRRLPCQRYTNHQFVWNRHKDFVGLDIICCRYSNVVCWRKFDGELDISSKPTIFNKPFFEQIVVRSLLFFDFHQIG